jgi:hypothetical protein
MTTTKREEGRIRKHETEGPHTLFSLGIIDTKRLKQLIIYNSRKYVGSTTKAIEQRFKNMNIVLEATIVENERSMWHHMK